MKSAIVTAALLVAAGAGLAAQSAPADPRLAKVDEIFKAYARSDSPGCAVGVYKDGRILQTRAYGMANLDHDVPLTPRSVFHVASVSKQFTAAAILLLAEDGKLSLDDPVQKHVTELADFGEPVTIRHLIHHTSGIRDQWTLLGLAGWRYSRDLITDDDVMSLLSRQTELNFQPGERHLYSNSGYTLLAIIVSRVSGKPFRTFTTERIFKPLGMTNTFFRDNFNEIVKHQAYGYSPAASSFRLSVTNFDTAGATSLLTTVEDLAKWNANFETPVVGGDTWLAGMLERGVLRNGTRISYASGLTHGTSNGLSTISHGGSDAGYRAAFVRFPEHRLAVSTLCNISTANPTGLANRVAAVYLGDLMKPEAVTPVADEPEVPVPAEELSRLAGMYWNADDAARRSFVFEGGKLQLVQGQQKRPLRPIGTGTFVLPGAQRLYLVFDKDRVTGGPLRGTGDVYERAEPFNPGPAVLDEFAGAYRSDELDAVYHLKRDGHVLRLERFKMRSVQLQPLVANTFSSSAGVLRFTRDQAGRIDGFRLEAGRVRGLRFQKEGLLVLGHGPLESQTRQTPPPAAPARAQQPAPLRPPARADILRGAYGRYRANNDLLFYHLDVRVDPEKKRISGRNTIRFKMLADDNRIQLDLYPNMAIEKILLGSVPLEYSRELNAVFVDFPETLKAGRDYAIDFYYSGTPTETGRFGGFSFGKDPAGNHWIVTANEGQGSSLWWPNKDQWRDEPSSMDLSVSIPNDLIDVSNGRFLGKKDLGDGYTRWDWRVHYPINSYNVSVNIGKYAHFGEKHGDLTLDYYVLPANLEKAKRQFAQVKPMLAAWEKIFGEYPFKKDGYKLIEVPYSGMEHQSAVTYGNRFANGYLERDWTGVGVSLKFDFIIIHESGHEWFGNAVSAADVSDMWLQEGWTTYLENLYVEQIFGYDDALKYVNGYKSKVRNREPIITQRGIHRTPSQDMYFKGALFLHTLRSVVNDDAKWWELLRGFYQRFKYQNILTEDMIAFFNAGTRLNLTPIFNQYLRRAALPVLELAFNDVEGTLAYRWKTDEHDFAMPIRIGKAGAWQLIQPTTNWQVMKAPIGKEALAVATELYYVDVVKQ
ncbi:MAG: serine hydrolase [Vicinamibacterales bacterium]